MWIYLFRRILYAIPILIGVNILTFALFFFVNSPEDIANIHLGGKYVTKEAKQDWMHVHGYDLPLFYNSSASGLDQITKTIFFEKSLKLFVFDFGLSDAGSDIGQTIKERYLPSLSLAIPTLLIEIAVNVAIALIMILFLGGYLELMGIVLCVILISISPLFFIIGGQYLFAKILKWVPFSGYIDGWGSMKFLALPILVGLVAGLGAGVRFYRSIFLEESSKDYVRTATAKGLGKITVLFKHILKNALIPILTGVVAILPLLFMGSLLMESFFGIPGLGSYTIDAIHQQDFAIVRSMTFLGTVLYVLGLILTDISYVMVDPRVRLES